MRNQTDDETYINLQYALESYLFSGIEWANVEGESESGEGGLLGSRRWWRWRSWC